jgi:hypothetical protein
LEAFKEVGVSYLELKFMAHTFDKIIKDIKVFAKDVMPSWT